MLIDWVEHHKGEPLENVRQRLREEWPFDTKFIPHTCQMRWLSVHEVDGPFIVVARPCNGYGGFDEVVIERDKADWIDPNDVMGYQTPR